MLKDFINILKIKNSWIIRKIDTDYFLINIKKGNVFKLNDFQINTLQKLYLAATQHFSQKELKFINELKSVGFLPEYRSKKIKIISTFRPHLYRVHWEITGLCNLKCKHCYNAPYNIDENDLNIDRIKNIIQEMNKMNVFRIQISGGEPFLRKDLFDIFDEIYRNYIYVDGIFTNATTIDNNLAKKLKELPWDTEIVVSLDGYTSQAHNNLRGEGSFEKVWRGIRNLDKNGLNITINTMLYKKNKNEICKLYDVILKIKNIKRWRIGTPNKQGRFKDYWTQYALPRKEVLDVYYSVLKRYIKNKDYQKFKLELGDAFHSDILKYGFIIYSLDDHPCKYAIDMCTIKANGIVTLCPSLDNIVFGTIRKSSLYDVWNSKEFEMFRSLKVRDLDDCRGCSYVLLCGGGCRANARDLTGNYLSKDLIACETMKWWEEKVLALLPENLKKDWENFLMSYKNKKIGGENGRKNTPI